MRRPGRPRARARARRVHLHLGPIQRPPPPAPRACFQGRPSLRAQAWVAVDEGGRRLSRGVFARPRN
eukprot:674897-Lingulodinium_polyedra.AAC.1